MSKAIVPETEIVQKAEIVPAVFVTIELALTAFVVFFAVLSSLLASLFAETWWHHSGSSDLVLSSGGSHQSG